MSLFPRQRRVQLSSSSSSRLVLKSENHTYTQDRHCLVEGFDKQGVELFALFLSQISSPPILFSQNKSLRPPYDGPGPGTSKISTNPHDGNGPYWLSYYFALRWYFPRYFPLYFKVTYQVPLLLRPLLLLLLQEQLWLQQHQGHLQGQLQDQMLFLQEQVRLLFEVQPSFQMLHKRYSSDVG